MAWNLNPPWVELGNINPDRYTSIEGVYASAYNKVLENLQYLYNHLGAADIEVDSTETYFVQPGGSVSIDTPDGVKTINYPGNILLYMTEEDHGEGIHTYHMKWYFVLPIPEVTVGDVNVSTTVFEPGQIPTSSIQITPQQTDTGTKLAFSFNVPAVKGDKGQPGTNGTDGRDGTDGTDGVGISLITSQTPSQSGGYTVTPVRVLKTDNTVQIFNVQARNGIDGVNGKDSAGAVKSDSVSISSLFQGGVFGDYYSLPNKGKYFQLWLQLKVTTSEGVYIGTKPINPEYIPVDPDIAGQGPISVALPWFNATKVVDFPVEMSDRYIAIYRGGFDTAVTNVELTITGLYSEASGGGGGYRHAIHLTLSDTTSNIQKYACLSFDLFIDDATRISTISDLSSKLRAYTTGYIPATGIWITNNTSINSIEKFYPSALQVRTPNATSIYLICVRETVQNNASTIRTRFGQGLIYDTMSITDNVIPM